MKNALPKMIIAIVCNMQIALAYPPSLYDFNVQHPTSTFEIKLNGAGMMTVAIDGKFFNEPVRKFSVSNITPGNHYLEIFNERVVHSGYYSNTEMVRIYSGKLYIQPASLIKGVVDNFGRFYIKNVDALVSYNYIDQDPAPWYPQNCQPAPVIMAPVAINGAEYDRLVGIVKDQWFEDTRLAVVQQALRDNWFTASQIAGLMQIMYFEDSRLEIAKAAYSRVIDPQAYYIVNREFWFSSSVDALTSYIATYR